MKKFTNKLSGWWLFLVAVLVGLMVAIQLQSQDQPAEADSRELPTVREDIRKEQERQQQLRQEILEYQILLSQYENSRYDNDEVKNLMEEELQKAREQSGYASKRGEGFILHIDVPGVQQKVNPYLARQAAYEQMQDDDLRVLTDELFGNGAEAIAINEERLVANSTIRKVGNTLQVNTRPVSLPFEVKVLGNPDVLISALMVSDAEIVERYASLGLEVVPEVPDENEEISVPAYSGEDVIDYMRPQKESES